MLFSCILLWTLLRKSVAIEEIKDGDGYRFHYEVDSKNDSIHIGHTEERHGYQTIGSYKTLLPDGRTQVVEYKVHDKDSGYIAKVSYKGVSTVDKPQYGQQRFKGIKREIQAGSFPQTVKIKPYGRDTEPHEQQISDIYTTVPPTTIENVTVIPSPEIVTIAQKYRLYEDNLSEESDSIKRVVKIKENLPGNHLNISDISSIKDDDALLSEKLKPTTVFRKTKEPVRVLPNAKIVTQSMEPAVKKENFEKYYFSLDLESDNSSFTNESAQSIPKETNIILEKVKNQTTDENSLSEQLNTNENVLEGTDQFILFVGLENANATIKNLNIRRSKHNLKQELPTYEYNFKPIHDKKFLTKAKDTFSTENNALYQTNFTPTSHHPFVLQKPVNNYNRNPKYTLQNKNQDNHNVPLRLPFRPQTRRQDGLSHAKKANVIDFKKPLKIPLLSLKNWFSF